MPTVALLSIVLCVLLLLLCHPFLEFGSIDIISIRSPASPSSKCNYDNGRRRSTHQYAA